jgi:hypothetical protein
LKCTVRNRFSYCLCLWHTVIVAHPAFSTVIVITCIRTTCWSTVDNK